MESSDGPAAIEAFGRNRATDKLQHIGRFRTGGNNNLELGGAQQNALVSDGRRVYAVNPGSNTVSALSIRSGGDLALIQQISSGGLRPVSMVISSTGRLYVANAGHTPSEAPQPATIVGFAQRDDGSLVRLPCAPATATPGELGNIIANIAISGSGTTLVATGLLSNQIDSFHIDAQGCLTKRQNLPGGGGAFAVNFRPGSDDAVITRAFPEVFGENAPGIGAFKVTRDSAITEVSTYVDPDKSDDGLRDPCWVVFAKDGVHFWVSSFIPRSINAFSLDARDQLTRLSEHQPSDDVADPSNPGGTVRVGSFDLAADKERAHLYQIRAFAVPDGQVNVPGAIHTYVPTGHFEVNAGLREVDVTPLPTDFENPCVVGLVFVDRS